MSYELGMQHISDIITKCEAENQTHENILKTIKWVTGQYTNKVRKHNERDYVMCRFTIPERTDGKWIIPNRVEIPKEYHGKDASNKEIVWYERKEDQFLNKVIGNRFE